jgi:hypothetical protein
MCIFKTRMGKLFFIMLQSQKSKCRSDLFLSIPISGRALMEELGESGPLRPAHIREAYRRLSEDGRIPTRGKKTLFKH